METKKGWEEQFAATLFKKEATFNTPLALNSTNACSLYGFEADVDWPDDVQNDKDTVTGREFGSDQEIIQQMVTLKYSENRAHPNSVIGFAGLVMGNLATTGAGADKTHTIIPAAVGVALPSITAFHKKGGVQYRYPGVKGSSFELKLEEGGLVSLAVEMMASGTRASNAEAFPAQITESWLLTKNCAVWKESGSAISIDATPTQSLENISSGTPTSWAPVAKSARFKFNNAPEGQPGFGGLGVYKDIDAGRRSVELEATLRFADATELNHFINQDLLAIEFDLAGSVIPTGTLKYGFQLIIPKFKLKKAPRAEGGVDDRLTLTIDAEVFEDGTNPVCKLIGYNAVTAYLAP